MTRSKSLKRLLAPAVVLAAALFIAASCDIDVESDTGVDSGHGLIPFTMTTLDGGTFTTDEVSGPLVINFWASWCGPCKLEADTLREVYLAYRDQGVEFVGVAVQDTADGARGFVETHGIPFPNGLDTDGSISREYNINAVPKTFVVDSDGTVTFEHAGTIPEDLLREEIEKVL